MARVQYGGLITDLSGSVGGATFQKSLYGNTLRTKPIPLRPAHPAQTVIRSYMTQLHAAWASLSSAERKQWNQFINFSGQTINRDSGVTLTGHDLFLKYNMFRLMAGFSIMTVPVYQTMPVTTGTPSLIRHPVSIELVYGQAVDPATLWFIFKISSARSASQAFSKQGIRYMNFVPVTGTQIYFKTLYEATFGVIPAIGSTVHVTRRFFSTVAPAYGREIPYTLVLQSP
jgi:hypothetical protein